MSDYYKEGTATALRRVATELIEANSTIEQLEAEVKRAFWGAFERAKTSDNMNIQKAWEDYQTDWPLEATADCSLPHRCGSVVCIWGR